MSGIPWRDVNPWLVRILSALALPSSSDPQGPKWAAEWKDRPLAATPDRGPMKGVTLTMKITTVIGIGSDDDVRYEQDSPTSGLRETSYGLRRVTLRLEVNSSEVDDSQWALSILERIRTRLRRRRVIRSLLDLNVGIISILAAIDISAKASQRVQSRAVMDLLLTMVSSDEDPVTVGWIAGVEITSKLQDVDGQLLPTPPNYTDTITTP